MELKLFIAFNLTWDFLLLIVPYGIETKIVLEIIYFCHASNRTLWNWNFVLVWIFEYKEASNRTLWNWNSLRRNVSQRENKLLIVPYGIETDNRIDGTSFYLLLLIVPYGIETAEILSSAFDNRTSNRTLWNWNLQFRMDSTLDHSASNRTLWNWNAQRAGATCPRCDLLIVPYGIETR